jgi:transporter family protein
VNLAAIMIGAVVPSVCLGLGTVLMRGSVGAGATIPAYLATVGTTIAVIGWSSLLLTGSAMASLKANAYAGAMGVSWSLAIACIAYGMGPLKLPVAIVAPLTNSNALVAVFVGAIIFSEWRELNMIVVGIGALLICAGAATISLSR